MSEYNLSGQFHGTKAAVNALLFMYDGKLLLSGGISISLVCLYTHSIIL